MVGLDMLSLGLGAILPSECLTPNVLVPASQNTVCTSTTDSKCANKRDFFTRYETLCKKLHAHPLKDVKAVGTGLKCVLDLMVDKIKFTDWIPLLKAIAGDRSLHSISLKSRIQLATVVEDAVTERGARELKKGVVLFTNYMLQKFTSACTDCLEHSEALRLLHLENIPIPMDFARDFSGGVSKTHGLQKLLLVGCQLGDEGCQIITEALKKVPSIHTLDLSGNDVTCNGAKNIANLIKFQGITRYNECWKHSLRAREVNTEAIPGLRRFSINDNQEVQDKGLKYIVEALADDNWIKAIDMQKCGITDRGCSMVSKLLETNKDIVVFDLRKNNVIDIMAIPSIMNQLNDNKKLSDGAEYKWIFIPNTSSGEDSSSGGGSSSSYNLSYTNEKVAKYVETTIKVGQKDPVRAVQSLSTLKAADDQSRPNRLVKFYRPAQRSASSAGIKTVQHPRRNDSETSATVASKRVTPPAASFRNQKYAKPGSVVRKVNQSNPQRQISLDNVAKHQNACQLRSTQSELSVKIPEPDGSSKRKERVSKTFVREEMLKQTLEVGTSHGKSTGRSDQHAPLDSSGKIEQALEELFKSWETANNEKQESKTSLSQINQDLTPSLSLEDFKADSNPKASRRIKETKKVCCLYFNRLEDGYEE